MMHKLFQGVGSLAVFTPTLKACPVCHSEVGQAVRAGIWGADFYYYLAASLLPFGFFFLVALRLYFGPRIWQLVAKPILQKVRSYGKEGLKS